MLKKIITIYLLLFIVSGCLSVFFNDNVIMEYITLSVWSWFLPVIFIFWIIFKKKNKIKDKFFINFENITKKVVKYFRIIWIIGFTVVLPLFLTVSYISTKNIFSSYYVLIIFLSVSSFLFPIYFVFSLFGLIVKIKIRSAWKNFGLDILILIISFLWVGKILETLAKKI